MSTCTWVKSDLEKEYHDTFWGKPVRDDQVLFEKLILDGMQAGLSWVTILKKQQGYEELFDHFDAHKIANYSDTELEEKLQDARIIRNRLKVYAIRNNAICYLKLKVELGSFSDYIWSFTNGKQIVNTFKDMQDIPAYTKISDAMSKDLKKRGFKFVGSTICYAFMQAVGIVNDHVITCDCYQACIEEETK